MSPAFGDTIGFTSPGGLGTATQLANLGNFFTISQPITVTALGFYDLGAGNEVDELVGLFSSDAGFTSGTLLTSTSVTVEGNTPVDGYFFQSITPIDLAPGTYVVEENTAGNDEWAFGGSGPPITAPGITYDTHQYTLGSASLIYPTGTAGAADTAYYGPNFEFTAQAIPEPSSLVLACLGTVFLLLLAARRHRTTPPAA